MKFANSWADVGTLISIGQSNLKLDALNKNNNEIKNISSSIGASQNELVNLNKQLVQIQTRILDTQNVQIGLQQKQLLLNEQQLIIQKKQLAEQEIQTSIQTRNELDRLKQQELKKAIYSINEEVARIRKIENNITRYFEIVLLIKDMISNNIVANEFDNISDKEYAANILYLVEETHKAALDRLNENEKRDIEAIEELLEKVTKNMSKLSNNEQRNLENEREKIESYIDSLDNEIKRINKHENNIKFTRNVITIAVTIAILVISVYLFVNSSAAKNKDDKIISLVASISFLIIPFVVYIIFKIVYSSDNRKNAIVINQKEIAERKKHLIYYDDKIKDMQVAQSELIRGLKLLMEQNSMLINKYPFVRNRLFADIENHLH